MTDQNRKPVRRFKAGSVSAAIWAAQVDKNGRTVTRYSVRIEKRYRDREGNFQTSHTFFPNDLPRVQLVTGKAYEFCSLQEKKAD